MNLMVLYQDSGQTEMEMSAITFGILKQNTQEHKSMANGEMHDTNILYNFNVILWRSLRHWVVVV